MSLFRVIGDVIEYDGLPLGSIGQVSGNSFATGTPRATLSPHVWPSLRSRVVDDIESLAEIDQFVVDEEIRASNKAAYESGFADGKASWGAP